MDNETVVILIPDEKELLLKSASDLFFAAQELHKRVSGDKLTEDMKDILASLIESHFIGVAKILNYTSHLTLEHEQRFVEIRNANGRIHELERMLADSKPIDGLKEQLQKLYETVRDWWNNDGFHHVGEFEFGSYGVAKMEFNFMLDRSSMFSSTPASDRLTKVQYLEKLHAQGYDIRNIQGDGLSVIDCENNRQLLTSLLKQRFPSIKIHKFNNWSVGKDNDLFALRSIEAYIYDLQDIPVNEIDKVEELKNE